MSTVTLDQILQDLTSIVSRVQAGETFVVIDADHPVFEIRPVGSTTAAVRPFGLCAGEFTVPETFDEPLPEETLTFFEPR